MQEEKTRDRKTTRLVSVFQSTKGINPQWKGVKTVIKVERTGTRAGKTDDELVYYISSLNISAEKIAAGIRGHWVYNERQQNGTPFNEISVLTP